MGVGSSVAPVAKKYMLTHQELSAKKQQNKQVVQCMAQTCNAQLVQGQRHHCRCCGIKVCAQTRQALSPPHSFLHTKLMSRRAAGVHRVLLPEEETPLFASAAEGVPGTDALIQRKFVDQWKINWSHGAPPAKVIEDLQALSATDKVKPIQLCGHSTEDVSLSLPAIFCSHSIKRLRRFPLIFAVRM